MCLQLIPHRRSDARCSQANQSRFLRYHDHGHRCCRSPAAQTEFALSDRSQEVIPVDRRLETNLPDVHPLAGDAPLPGVRGARDTWVVGSRSRPPARCFRALGLRRLALLHRATRQAVATSTQAGRELLYIDVKKLRRIPEGRAHPWARALGVTPSPTTFDYRFLDTPNIRPWANAAATHRRREAAALRIGQPGTIGVPDASAEGRRSRPLSAATACSLCAASLWSVERPGAHAPSFGGGAIDRRTTDVWLGTGKAAAFAIRRILSQRLELMTEEPVGRRRLIQIGIAGASAQDDAVSGGMTRAAV